jgi:hypothetical protein
VTEQLTDEQFYDSAEELERSGTPLRRFWLDVTELEPRSENNRRFVEINGDNPELAPYPADHTNVAMRGKPGAVIPYDFPMASLTINYNLTRAGRPSENGAWGLFVTSVNELGFARARDLRGNRILFEAEPDHEYRPAGNDRDGNPQERIAGMVWRVVGKAGASDGVATPVDTDTHFIAMLGEGMTQQDFAGAALRDAVGRANQQSIINGSILTNLVASGKVKLEGDLYKPS